MGLVWDTNTAAISLFWYTNMAAVTSCQNALLKILINSISDTTASKNVGKN